MNDSHKPQDHSDNWDEEVIDLFENTNETDNHQHSNNLNTNIVDLWRDTYVQEIPDYTEPEAEISEVNSFSSSLSLNEDLDQLFEEDSFSETEPLSSSGFEDLDQLFEEDFFSETVDLTSSGDEDLDQLFEEDSFSETESLISSGVDLTLDNDNELLAFTAEADRVEDLNTSLDLEEELSGFLESESTDSNLLDWNNLEEAVSGELATESLDSSEGEAEEGISVEKTESSSTTDLGDNLLELDNFLEESKTDSAFEHLEGFLSSSDIENELDTNEELTTLDSILDSSAETQKDSPLVPSQPRASNSSSSRPSKNKVFDQTMRVSVRKLDNLNNMIGELVVKRNRLEDDQERLRQFIDNLFTYVQTLGDAGTRMHDLYERSLLEGALIASRQQNQKRSSYPISGFGVKSVMEKTEDGLDALELDRFTGFHLLSQEIIELIVRVREAASDIQFVVDETDKVTQSLRQVTSQLQEGINSTRMVTFGQTTERLPRAIRDVSHKLKKQVELHVEGKDVLIDKLIVEHLYNPMTHLVNNAITHGIESPTERVKQGKNPAGKISIRAFIQGNQIVINVADDGAGIDPEKVKAKAVEKNLMSWANAQNLSQQEIYALLFHPGFSTKDQADDFAGRGVGMDVVSTDLNKIRGTISIESRVGKGTTFTIRLPLVLSICKALICNFNNSRIAFPIDGVEDTKEYPLSEVKTNANGVKCISWQDKLLPFQPLSSLLSYNRQLSRGSIYGGSNKDEETLSIIILRSADNLLAVEVDEILAEQEIVIKQLEGPIPKPAGISGATVLGDGSIMPIGDVLELLEIAQGKRTTEIGLHLWQAETTTKQIQVEKTEPLVLVVDDSITVRELLSLSFNKLGYRVEQARDGQEGWDKLRNGLPCDMIFCDIEMPRMNGLELLSHLQKDEQLRKIPVAMLTSRGAEKHRKLATDLGAKAYLTKPYTEKDLMDIAQRLIQINQFNKIADSKVTSSQNHSFAQVTDLAKQKNSEPLVLIIDDSVTVRELLSMTFKKAGFQVEQARDGQEAWEKLRAGLNCDLAFCDIEMPRMNGLELLSRLQEDTKLSSLPVAMLTSRGAQKMRSIAAQRGAKGYFVKPYVEDALLEAAQRLMKGEILIENINIDELYK
jgi:chemosensory pili system protein ChpA (sensor histidine kinase/response regulator)